jgi:hypothetical protein
MLLAVASRRIRALLTATLSLVGVALLAYQVAQVGPSGILDRLRQVGWGFLALLALSLPRLVLRSAAWRSLLVPRPRFTRTLAATISGDALGNVTPLSLLVSEPAKAFYVGDKAGAGAAFAALTAENFFYSVSVAIYITLGTAAMLGEFRDRLPARVVTAGTAALGAMALVLAGAAWLAWQRPAVLSGLLSRLPGVSLSRMADRVRQFEVDAYGSAGGHASRLGVVAACEAGFHLFSLAEAWATLWLLTGQASLLTAFVLDTANRIVNVVARPIPMRAGVDEVTSETVAVAIGIAPGVGTAMGLVRKARVLVWAAVGFGLLAKRVRRWR